jgi:hypothetical protein
LWLFFPVLPGWVNLAAVGNLIALHVPFTNSL